MHQPHTHTHTHFSSCLPMDTRYAYNISCSWRASPSSCVGRKEELVYQIITSCMYANIVCSHTHTHTHTHTRTHARTHRVSQSSTAQPASAMTPGVVESTDCSALGGGPAPVMAASVTWSQQLANPTSMGTFRPASAHQQLTASILETIRLVKFSLSLVS